VRARTLLLSAFGVGLLALIALWALLAHQTLVAETTPPTPADSAMSAATPRAEAAIAGLRNAGYILGVTYANSRAVVRTGPAWDALELDTRTSLAKCAWGVLHYARGGGDHVEFVDGYTGKTIGEFDPRFSGRVHFR
jgi:hypothetical protein